MVPPQSSSARQLRTIGARCTIGLRCSNLTEAPLTSAEAPPRRTSTRPSPSAEVSARSILITAYVAEASAAPPPRCSHAASPASRASEASAASTKPCTLRASCVRLQNSSSSHKFRLSMRNCARNAFTLCTEVPSSAILPASTAVADTADLAAGTGDACTEAGLADGLAESKGDAGADASRRARAVCGVVCGFCAGLGDGLPSVYGDAGGALCGAVRGVTGGVAVGFVAQPGRGDAGWVVGGMADGDGGECVSRSALTKRSRRQSEERLGPDNRVR
mmetsp:Transcript_45486/g.106371  ORF Transcript_45486/g.106371 Transcript_45486/m.106371 type:complete len:276 (-) Transcript_45486:811-1638(-)